MDLEQLEKLLVLLKSFKINEFKDDKIHLVFSPMSFMEYPTTLDEQAINDDLLYHSAKK